MVGGIARIVAGILADFRQIVWKNVGGIVAECWRNFGEILRALDALQTSSAHGIATPVNWAAGEDVIIPPTVSDEDAKAKFGSFDAVLPYLRKTKLPE